MASPLDFCIDFIVVRDTQKLCCCLVAKSCLTLGTPQTVVTHQAPLSMGFSRQEYWSGLQFLSPGDLPHPGREPTSPALQVDSLLLSHQERWYKWLKWYILFIYLFLNGTFFKYISSEASSKLTLLCNHHYYSFPDVLSSQIKILYPSNNNSSSFQSQVTSLLLQVSENLPILLSNV